jgi:hypothetical protein
MVKAGQFEGDICGLLGIVVLINVENGNDLGLLQGIGRNRGRKGKPLATTDRCVLSQVDQIGRRENYEGIGGLELFLDGPGDLDMGPGDQGILATCFGEGEFQNVVLCDLFDIGKDMAVRKGVYVGLLLKGDIQREIFVVHCMMDRVWCLDSNFSRGEPPEKIEVAAI